MRYILCLIISMMVLCVATCVAAQDVNAKVSQLAALGNSQGTAAPVLSRYSYVTGSDGTKGVILPATAYVGSNYTMYNSGTLVLKIYPHSGAKINGGSTNASVSTAAKSVTFCQYAFATQWVCSEAPPA